jgi:putative transposase
MHNSPRQSKSGPLLYFTLQNGGRNARTFGATQRDQLSDLVAEALAETAAIRAHAFSWTRSDIRIALEAGQTDLRRFVRTMASLHRDRLHDSLCGATCLFERTYGAAPLETDRDLLQAVEHIHTAPVRAGLAPYPADYGWSSCRAYLGLEVVPWLTTSTVSPLRYRSQTGSGAYAARRPVSDPSEAFRNPL